MFVLRFMHRAHCAAIVLALGVAACAADAPDASDDEPVGDTEQAASHHWVGGRALKICRGAVHVRTHAYDGSPSRGLAPDGTPVHDYSNRDAEDGRVGWDPVIVEGSVDIHGWIETSHLCPR